MITSVLDKQLPLVIKKITLYCLILPDFTLPYSILSLIISVAYKPERLFLLSSRLHFHKKSHSGPVYLNFRRRNIFDVTVGNKIIVSPHSLSHTYKKFISTSTYVKTFECIFPFIVVRVRFAGKIKMSWTFLKRRSRSLSDKILWIRTLLVERKMMR